MNITYRGVEGYRAGANHCQFHHKIDRTTGIRNRPTCDGVTSLLCLLVVDQYRDLELLIVWSWRPCDPDARMLKLRRHEPSIWVHIQRIEDHDLNST